MSELAFNANGETFEVPANVTGWRVRRMKPRGAPELVYGRDGRPLIIAIDSNTDDLRDAVSAIGKYRLDPVNDEGRTVEGVPAAYVQVVSLGEDDAGLVPSPRTAYEDPIREAMRSNTELARTIVDRFPDMMTAAAELLRAADGAGLPARPGQFVPCNDVDEPDEEETAEAFDLNAFVGQLVPLVIAGLADGKLKLPNLAAMLDWRKATPTPVKRTRSTAHVNATSSAPLTKQTEESVPPLDPQTMAHFMAVQAVLSPDEAAIARNVASELAPGELRSWIDELRALSVPEAVAKVRTLIAGRKETSS